MAGTRTAPTIDGTPNYRLLSLRLVDKSNDKRAETFEIALASDPADIEDFVAGYALRTNSSVYGVYDVSGYVSPAQASNAGVGTKSSSVADGINFLYTGATGDSEDVRLIAPIGSLFVGDTDGIDPVAAAAFNALVTPLLVGTKVPITAQYTERKEKQNNPKLGF